MERGVDAIINSPYPKFEEIIKAAEDRTGRRMIRLLTPTFNIVPGGEPELEPERKIIAFCCNWCSYAGADMAGTSRMQYPSSVRIIRTMCSGRVSWKHIDRAFARRAALVLVSGCHPAIVTT
jgi:hypothetical protein